MPSAATTYYGRQKLIPVLSNGREPLRTSVQLVPSVSLAQGTVLGELTATPGTFKAYATGNTDGSQVAKCILEYTCSTDASGNITINGDFGATFPSVSAFLGNQGAEYNTADLVGLDAGALTALGGSISQGVITAGKVVI